MVRGDDLTGHRRHGVHAGTECADPRVVVPRDLPGVCRPRQRRHLRHRSAIGAGVHPGLQTRLGQRIGHDHAACRRHAGWAHFMAPAAGDRLAMAVPGGPGAAGAGVDDPLLGAESPRWLIRMGRLEEARRSLAWALMIDPKEITLPAAAETAEKTRWLELFKYPRLVLSGCLTGLTQTGGASLGLWGATLLVLVMKISPADAAYLMIWVGVAAILGR